jgi:hypothetical protein
VFIVSLMEPKIIEITEDIKTFYLHTYEVPAGIPALFDEFEKRVADFDKYHLYGVTECVGDKMIYRACVEEMHEGDGGKFSLPCYNIPKGKYLYVVFKDWRQHIPEMPGAFANLMRRPDAKKGTICLEDYQSYGEMLLMVEHK